MFFAVYVNKAVDLISPSLNKNFKIFPTHELNPRKKRAEDKASNSINVNAKDKDYPLRSQLRKKESFCWVDA